MTVRKYLPVIIGFVAGIIVLGGFFFSNPSIKVAATEIVSWRTTLAAFSLVLGSLNLIRVNWGRARGGKSIDAACGWVLLATITFMVVIGLSSGTTAAPYAFLYDYVYRSGGATVFALNAFFVASAAYRAFRVRNVQGAVFMVAGLLAVLGPSAIGGSIWLGFPRVASWFLSGPVMGATRGFEICLALGIIAMGLRALLGLERGYFGGE